MGLFKDAPRHSPLQFCQMFYDFLIGVHGVLLDSQPVKAFDNLAYSVSIYSSSPFFF